MSSANEPGDLAKNSDKVYATPSAELVDPERQIGTANDTLFSKNGRLGVRAYCARMLWVLPPLGVCLALIIEFPQFEHRLNDVHAAIVVGGILTVVLLFTVLLVLYACTCIKRLHDLGHSGWLVVFSGVPIAGSIFSIYYSFAPPTDAVNQYGEIRKPNDAQRITGIIGAIVLGLLFSFSLINSVTSLLHWLAH